MKKLVEKIKDTLSIFSSSKGFTLLELLVVVLIIGILAAIALPQYKYSVMKTKYMRMADIARVIKDAQERYYLVNNAYAKHFSDLDINFKYDEINSNEDGNEDAATGDIAHYLLKDQVKIVWIKNEEYYMMYSLRLDNINMWGGSRGLCAAYSDSGENGKKICRSMPNASNCKDNTSLNRYNCRFN